MQSVKVAESEVWEQNDSITSASLPTRRLHTAARSRVFKPSVLDTSPGAFPGQIRGEESASKHNPAARLTLRWKTDERPNDYLNEEEQTPASAKHQNNASALFAF